MPCPLVQYKIKTAASDDWTIVSGKILLLPIKHLALRSDRNYRSSGVKPVCLAIRAQHARADFAIVMEREYIVRPTNSFQDQV